MTGLGRLNHASELQRWQQPRYPVCTDTAIHRNRNDVDLRDGAGQMAVDLKRQQFAEQMAECFRMSRSEKKAIAAQSAITLAITAMRHRCIQDSLLQITCGPIRYTANAARPLMSRWE